MRLLIAAAVLLIALPEFAQPSGGTADLSDAAITPEPASGGTAPEGVAPAVDTPTRRPTHAPTATATLTASPADSESATAAPALTPTFPPSAIPTATAVIPASNVVEPPPPVAALPITAPMLAGSGTVMLVLGAGLALVAVWLGARLSGARTRIDRRRARRTLATAMLLELRRIDAVLRRVVTLDTAGSFPPLEHPIMEAALRDLTLFQTATAARIAQFHSTLRGIQHEIGDYRDNPLRWAGRLTELHQLIKNRSAAACRTVPELVKALEHEGGKPPPPLPEPTSPRRVDPAGLPPPPFGAHEGDDWTL